MKKQNITNKLAFDKAAVTELNDQQIQTINGGTSSGVCDIIVSYIIVKGYGTWLQAL